MKSLHNHDRGDNHERQQQNVRKKYSKDVGIGALILEWIPKSVELVFVCILAATATGILLHLLYGDSFSMKWYLVNDSPLVDLGLYSLVAFAVSLWVGWERYGLIKKKFFASVNDENLMLRFGRNSFLRENIQKVDLEGDRKLIIVSFDKRRIRKNLFDLKWLSEKEGFIHILKGNCAARNIPYHESEINFFLSNEVFSKFFLSNQYITQ